MKARSLQQPPPADDRLRRMVEEVLPIAQKRTNLLGEMRDALLVDDRDLVVVLARRLVGLPPLESKP